MEQKACGHCPSEADLTVYYDSQRGDVPSSPELASIGEHVSSCPSCQAKLASYARLDELLSDMLEAPAGLSDRIKTVCHRVAEDDRLVGVSDESQWLPVPWWRVALRRASLWIVGLGIAGAGLWYGLSVDSPAPVQVARVEVSASSTSPSAVPSGKKPEPRPISSGLAVVSPSSPMALRKHDPVFVSSSGIGSHDLIPVGIGARRSSRRVAELPPRFLGEAVRHVWMADDLKQIEGTISSALAGMEGVSVSYAGEKEGRLIAHIDGLDDRSLQRVVEKLESKNWALVSPMLPQPGQSKRVAFNGHPVSYTVWVIEKDKK